MKWTTFPDQDFIDLRDIRGTSLPSHSSPVTGDLFLSHHFQLQSTFLYEYLEETERRKECCAAYTHKDISIESEVNGEGTSEYNHSIGK